jgi:anaerobic dimethyl sulfoxide reductase subunit B (iron-sulfur subunit)
MQKCDLCLDRFERGQRPICIEACPMFALDTGNLKDLEEKYGAITEAEGFRYSAKVKPSVLFKPKRGV